MRRVTFLSLITYSQAFQADWVIYTIIDTCNASHIELGCHVILGLVYILHAGNLSNLFSKNIK